MKTGWIGKLKSRRDGRQERGEPISSQQTEVPKKGTGHIDVGRRAVKVMGLTLFCEITGQHVSIPQLPEMSMSLISYE